MMLGSPISLKANAHYNEEQSYTRYVNKHGVLRGGRFIRAPFILMQVFGVRQQQPLTSNISVNVGAVRSVMLTNDNSVTMRIYCTQIGDKVGGTLYTHQSLVLAF